MRLWRSHTSEEPEVAVEKPTRPRPPALLREAGYSDDEIVRFAITYPFSDVPSGLSYHEQGRQALDRILARVGGRRATD